MRQIKFRAWHHEDGKMEYSDCPPSFSFWKWLSYDSRDLESLMQFTGIKDAKGAEVYEGDVVDAVYPMVIRFSDKNAAFIGVPVSQHVTWMDIENRLMEYWFIKLDITIIGNIWQNPELLNSESGTEQTGKVETS